MNSHITQQELKTALHYDPLTGIFTWKKSKLQHMNGRPAGSIISNGNRIIRINGKKCYASSLAILYMTGKQTKYTGHKNEDKKDNRYQNLYPSDTRIHYKLKEIQQQRTPSANEVMDAIDGQITFTMRQIAKNLGLQSITTLKAVIWKLFGSGYIHQPNPTRSTRFAITQNGQIALHNRQDFDKPKDDFLPGGLRQQLFFYKNCCPGNTTTQRTKD